MPGSNDADQGTGAELPWEERRSEHFVFVCEPGSYAARTLETIVARAEATHQRAREWFGQGEPAPRVLVYLEDWLDDAPPVSGLDVGGAVVATNRDAIWAFVSPEHPNAGLERAVLAVLARARVAGRGGEEGVPGPRPGPPTRPPTPGALWALAGLLAARSGVGPSPEEADRVAYERHVAGKAAARLFAEHQAGTNTMADPAEVSFLSFLERTTGRTALARFADGILESEPNAAAAAASGKSLATLEAEWLAALRAAFRGRMTGEGVLRRALPLLRPHWLRVAELAALMGINLVFELAIPLSSKVLFDAVIARGDYALLAIWLVAVLAIFAVGSLASYRRVVVGSLIGELVLRDLRGAVFHQFQRLSLRFYTRSNTGDLLTRISTDLDNVQEALGQTMPVLAFQLISLVVGAIALLLLNWKLGLIVLLVSAPIFAAIYSRASERLSESARELQDQIGAFAAFVQENLSAQLLIKSYGLERRAIVAFRGILALLFDGSMRMIRIAALLQSSSGMIFHATRVVVLAGGALLVLNGQMTVGELVAFVAMIVQVLQPVVGISDQYQHLQTAAGSFDRVQELMDERPDVVEDPLAVELPELRSEIRLEDVTFRYGGGPGGLHGVSLTIPAGARVAVVGPSGAGKSTLTGLLLRLYDPNQGRILFDGRDIREATLASLRGQQALVHQESFLFNTTLLENIAVGREGASEAEVARVARAAALERVIEQSEAGYRTVVGERGARLSGGQRQRLAIARALLRDPRVLILDEATSALDPETESAILQTIEEVGRGRTVVMITHRLSSAVDSDTIFVLDEGHLVEQGTHQQLCEWRGLYWRLYSEQQGAPAEAWPPSVASRRLARVPLFASLSRAELEEVARRLSVERYPPGTAVVREGETAEKLYVITSGEVEVLVMDRAGLPLRVNRLGERSYFGEIGLLRDGPARRMATVRSLTAVELLSLHRDDFGELLRARPRLAEAVGRLAQMRARQSQAVAESGSRPG